MAQDYLRVTGRAEGHVRGRPIMIDMNAARLLACDGAAQEGSQPRDAVLACFLPPAFLQGLVRLERHVDIGEHCLLHPFLAVHKRTLLITRWCNSNTNNPRIHREEDG